MFRAVLAGPVSMAEGAHRRLVSASPRVTGIETPVVLRDTCGLDDAEAVTRWTAQTLLNAALADAATGGSRR